LGEIFTKSDDYYENSYPNFLKNPKTLADYKQKSKTNFYQLEIWEMNELCN